MRPHERAVTRLLNDSKELNFIREETAALEWRNFQLGLEVIALRRALQELQDTYFNATITDDMMDNITTLLTTPIEICACGHLLLSEHDSKGCLWLHCAPICSVAAANE